jgi:hypothetical protein
MSVFLVNWMLGLISCLILSIVWWCDYSNPVEGLLVIWEVIMTPWFSSLCVQSSCLVLMGVWPFVWSFFWVVDISEVVISMSVLFVNWMMWLISCLILSIIWWCHYSNPVESLLVIRQIVVAPWFGSLGIVICFGLMSESISKAIIFMLILSGEWSLQLAWNIVLPVFWWCN